MADKHAITSDDLKKLAGLTDRFFEEEGIDTEELATAAASGGQIVFCKPCPYNGSPNGCWARRSDCSFC